MKIIKPTYVVIIAAFTLANCSTLKNKPVPVVNVTVPLLEKKSPIDSITFKKWAHADIVRDTIPGMSLDKAYQFLANKKGKTIIVGVVDSGIDINHEDLKGEVWTNPKEIPNNGIDDDKNGFTDDIHGWNFLGGNGVAAPEQLEITRLVAKMNPRFEGKTIEDIKPEDKADFEKYQEYLAAYKASSTHYFQTLDRLAQIGENYTALKNFLRKDSISMIDLLTLKTDDPMLSAQRDDILSLMGRGLDEEAYLEYYENQKKNKNYDFKFNGRTIVGDNPEDITDTKYGTSNVIGSTKDESHGTHVSGIILAARDNGMGINGITNKAKLMAVRVVPDGDERDKDVALAIRYAVDNGAKVINMSFGKSWSPNKEWVFDAIKYAAAHDVLLVHAAGNDSKDIDVKDNWPNDSADHQTEFTDNVITVGAIGPEINENLVAPFSNYGQKNVDIFAPGVQIYSTIPESKYAKYSGTSMASPEVAGVAALIRSYYPKLSASQVKHILMNSGTPIDMEVLIPGKKEEKENFSKLSVSGKILNAYNALTLADKMVHNK